MQPIPPRVTRFVLFAGLPIAAATMIVAGVFFAGQAAPTPTAEDLPPAPEYQPRKSTDPGGFAALPLAVRPWRPDATLQEISDCWAGAVRRRAGELSRVLTSFGTPAKDWIQCSLEVALLLNADGAPDEAYKALAQARRRVESSPSLKNEWLFTVIYYQGVTALRRGETDNCVLCRGDSSCIVPISRAAVHTKPEGSRLAVEHFTEYLRQFPDDFDVAWLLNISCMTLGEHPDKVDPKHLISLDRFARSEFDIGRFRDVGAAAGVNRFNQAGGAIMDDFDRDGLLDLFVTSWDPTQHMAFYRNKGDGTFEERTKEAGLVGQLGGLYCVQADYDNDGHLDVFICRGAWMQYGMQPSLLRNNGEGGFVDVTEKAGLLAPVNSNSACWADYDNDGRLDLFVCCEKQPNRLYRNKGDGTFEEVAGKAGLGESGRFCKGANWIDFDNDGYPDLFVNNLNGMAGLYRNNRAGGFSEVSTPMGIDGPPYGFACWAWDYDNDGWLDIFATCYTFPLREVVKGLQGQPHDGPTNRLFRNKGGKGFQDVTSQAGLDMLFVTMGCNFADLDNDGYLDMYLGTGDPKFASLVPNRMFKNVEGKRFAEITGSSGTGHLQKGHGVACGDWDHDGDVDVFIETGGAVDGDRFHNVLFQNPGQGNNWLSVKLVGKNTNRSAIGARIKVVAEGEGALTVHRHVTSGSSFGANPLEQMVGLGKAGRVATLEVHWPTSGTTQTFHDVAVNQAVEITESVEGYKKLPRRPISLPK
jgi:hypothetical protein